MSEIVERVARAICRADYIDGHPRTDERVDRQWHLFTTQARAAIEAMREPTREMWAAMGDAVVAHKQHHHDIVAGRLWNDVIDAALK